MATMTEQKERFVTQLRKGGLVAYPTEAVFGLGCDPLNEEAVNKLLALKERSWEKGLILIAASMGQLDGYIKRVPDHIISRILSPHDEAITWLLPAKESVPRWVRGTSQSIAVRLVQHPLARELCELAGGPLISTSANKTGQAPLISAEQVRVAFSAAGVFIIDGEVGSGKQTSQIIDPFSNKRFR